MKNEFSKIEKQGQLALALSGGGARGIVHIGVFAALDEYGVAPSRIAGPVWVPLSVHCTPPA